MTDSDRDRDRRLWARLGCTACARSRGPAARCDAFPAGIPIEIASGRLDHFAPRDGDRGLRFRARPDITLDKP